MTEFAIVARMERSEIRGSCREGFLGKATPHGRGAASGMYLACYFFGGLVGTAVLGQLFDRFGWPACVAGIGVSLLLAGALTGRLKPLP